MTNSINEIPSIHPGSFRDPSGQVFSYRGLIYRSIYPPGIQDFESANQAGVYAQLITAGLMQDFSEVGDFKEFAPPNTVRCIRPPQIPMISYPWEWPFSMLKDAALIHLDIMEQIIPAGFWLKDASAFNVQYDGGKLCLIDTLSVAKREPNRPWVAYQQFCSHFLAPLSVAAFCDIRFFSLWREYNDGYPLDLAAKMLPLSKRFSPGLFMHLLLHSSLQKSSIVNNASQKNSEFKPPHISDFSLLGLIRSLRRTIKKLDLNHSSKFWTNYTASRNYREHDLSKKISFVKQALQASNPKNVWDLGGNTGEFSILAAENGAFVTSIDSDPNCTEILYQKIKNEHIHGVLPLTMNICNPSPGLGWNNQERLSLNQRGPTDLVMALALIHHLVLTSNIPLELVASWLADTCNFLIIEFIPESDPMAKRLLWTRGEDHLPYTVELFRSSFERYFIPVDEVQLENGRSLFFYRHI